jgi:hypothetical protein
MDWIKNYRIAREIFNPSLATAPKTFEESDESIVLPNDIRVNFIQKKQQRANFDQLAFGQPT